MWPLTVNAASPSLRMGGTHVKAAVSPSAPPTGRKESTTGHPVAGLWVTYVRSRGAGAQPSYGEQDRTSQSHPRFQLGPSDPTSRNFP